MKYWVLAAIFVVACTTAQTPQQATPAAASSSAPTYSDARSSASDADVRDARRAYRSACAAHQSTAYCECMTGGMAQALAPDELAVATAVFSGQSISASQSERDHVAAVRTEVERGCVQFRRALP